MKLSEQVITLEQAKKLSELWFNRNSLWKIEGEYQTIYQVWRDYLWDWYRANDDMSDWWEEYCCYTATELMDILPESILTNYMEGWDDIDYMLVLNKTYSRRWDEVTRWLYNVYYTSDFDDLLHDTQNTNLAQALWDMLIYLLENNLLPKDTNE